MKSQLVRWPVMFTRLRGRLNVKLKPVELPCSYGLSNNFMLHSVYFRSLVDLENKSCVRVPLLIILPECREMNQCCCDGLKKTLQMVCEQFHSNNFHKAFVGPLLDAKIFKPYRHSDDIYLRVALLHNSSFLNQPVA